jgi:hypothetical protein
MRLNTLKLPKINTKACEVAASTVRDAIQNKQSNITINASDISADNTLINQVVINLPALDVDTTENALNDLVILQTINEIDNNDANINFCLKSGAKLFADSKNNTTYYLVDKTTYQTLLLDIQTPTNCQVNLYQLKALGAATTKNDYFEKDKILSFNTTGITLTDQGYIAPKKYHIELTENYKYIPRYTEDEILDSDNTVCEGLYISSTDADGTEQVINPITFFTNIYETETVNDHTVYYYIVECIKDQLKIPYEQNLYYSEDTIRPNIRITDEDLAKDITVNLTNDIYKQKLSSIVYNGISYNLESVSNSNNKTSTYLYIDSEDSEQTVHYLTVEDNTISLDFDYLCNFVIITQNNATKILCYTNDGLIIDTTGFSNNAPVTTAFEVFEDGSLKSFINNNTKYDLTKLDYEGVYLASFADSDLTQSVVVDDQYIYLSSITDLRTDNKNI